MTAARQETTERTKVVIVGAGPAGTALGLRLLATGIDCVVLERQSREYVLGRIRAGVLEWGSVEFLRSLGLAIDGSEHAELSLGWRDNVLNIDLARLTGKPMMVYGQTMIQHDLYDEADRRGLDIRFSVGEVTINDVTGDGPHVTFTDGSQSPRAHRIDCALIAGCDGFHGVSRHCIPESIKSEYEKSYPFGWLGIMSETPPLPELLYANSTRGFALCSQRNEMLSRYYVQCDIDDDIDQWSDDRFWDELGRRLPASVTDRVVQGPSIEKSIAPLRSYVVEPLQYGHLFLAGDAAHIVPPTGAKGLNLALSDVQYLARAIERWNGGDRSGLDNYSTQALKRVWGSVRFSWWLTTLLHRFPGQTEFDQRMQEKDLEYLASSEAAQTSMAEQYVGLPL